jgi:hypothetical protein
MRKIILALSLIVISCQKETTPPQVWECNLGNGIKATVISDTMPIIKSINEFGFPIVCNCYKIK